jgi:hypothetical protein
MVVRVSYGPTRLGIDSWVAYKVYKYGLRLQGTRNQTRKKSSLTGFNRSGVANTHPEMVRIQIQKNALDVIILKIQLTLRHCLQILLDLICEQMAEKIKNIFYKQFVSKKLLWPLDGEC